MEKIIGIYEQFDKKYDSFVARVKIYLEPRVVMLCRWIPCLLVYAYFYISEIYHKQFVKLCLMMTSAFFIFVQHILGAQYVFVTEGRMTKIKLGKDDDDRGLHYTFPEVKFWLGFVFSSIFYWWPMKTGFYHWSIWVVFWLFLFVSRVLVPFSKLRKNNGSGFWETMF